MTTIDSVQDRIIAEATRLFGSRGYGSTSVRELVQAAGVTKPTLYYHFGNKEGLFVATAQAHLHALDRMAADALAVDGSLEEQLSTLLEANIRFALEQPDVLRFLMTCLHQVDHGQPQIDMMSVDATLVRYLGKAFYEAAERGEVDPRIDVPIAVVNFLGVLRTWSVGAFHGAPLPPDAHHTVVRHFLHGVHPR